MKNVKLTSTPRLPSPATSRPKEEEERNCLCTYSRSWSFILNIVLFDSGHTRLVLVFQQSWRRKLLVGRQEKDCLAHADLSSCDS